MSPDQVPPVCPLPCLRLTVSSQSHLQFVTSPWWNPVRCRISTLTRCQVAGPRVQTVAGPSLLTLTCPSFLSVHLVSLVYGRRAGKGVATLCNGKMDRSPMTDCLDTSLLEQWREECRGRNSCEHQVTEGMLHLGAACSRVKPEMRVNHTCVNCAPWAKLIAADDCAHKSLLVNGWVGQEEPEEVGVDARSLLVEALHSFLDPDKHSKEDLSSREDVEWKGGLCGLAALYWALTDTLYTTSKVATMGYLDMRKAMQEVLEKEAEDLDVATDEQLLELYELCELDKFGYATLSF